MESRPQSTLEVLFACKTEGAASISKIYSSSSFFMPHHFGNSHFTKEFGTSLSVDRSEPDFSAEDASDNAQ